MPSVGITSSLLFVFCHFGSENAHGELPVCVQAKDSDDDEEVVQVDRDHFMDEFFEQVSLHRRHGTSRVTCCPSQLASYFLSEFVCGRGLIDDNLILNVGKFESYFLKKLGFSL